MVVRVSSLTGAGYADEAFPICTCVFPEVGTMEFVDEHFSWMHEQAKRGPFVLIADVRPLSTKTATAAIRAAFFSGSEKFDREIGNYAGYLGEAIIVGSAVQRALISAYLWFMNGAPYPTKVVQSHTEAEVWCKARIEEMGIKF